MRKFGAGVGALDVRRSRPAVALRVRLRASPSTQYDTKSRNVGCRGWCARRLEIPTCGRPAGSTSGCRPPLRMTRGAEVGCRGLCARRLEIPTCGRPDGFDSGLRPPLRMTRKGGFMLFQCGDNHLQWLSLQCLLTYDAETNESLLQWEKVVAEG